MIRSGTKVEVETDIDACARHAPTLQRVYLSNTPRIGMFGRGWGTVFDAHFLRLDNNSIGVRDFDGNFLVFQWVASAGHWLIEQRPGVYSAVTRLVRVATSPERFELRNGDGSVTTFAGGGSLLSHRTPTGEGWSLQYDDPERVVYANVPNFTLRSMTTTNGRRLQFGWGNSSGQPLVTQVIDPAGQTVRYEYAGVQLSAVVYPPTPHMANGGDVRSDRIDYHYLDNLLLGKSFNGVRYSTFAYGSLGRAVSSEHAGGVERFAFAYPDASTTVVTNPLGRTTTYRYDDKGQLLGTTTAATANTVASSTSASYSADGKYQSEIGTDGRRLDRWLDDEGRVVQEVLNPQLGSAAQTTTFTWDPLLNLLTRVSTPQGVVNYRYDAKRRVVEMIVTGTSGGTPLVTSWTYTDAPSGLPIQIITDGPLPGSADVITQTFNASGDLSSVTSPAGTTTYSGHDAFGRPTQIQDPNGLIATLTYDARGRVIAQSVAGQVSRRAYNVQGQVLQEQLAGQNLVTNTYDAAGRLLAVGSPDSFGAAVSGRGADDRRFVTFTRNAASNVLQSVQRIDVLENVFFPDCGLAPECLSPDTGYEVPTWVSNTTTIATQDVDEDGNLLRQHGNNGQRLTVTRDAAGRVRTVTDATGLVVETNDYDAFGRLQRTVNGKGEAIQMGYDIAGRLATVTDPKGNVTRYDYDDAGRLSRLTSPDTGVTQYTYNAAGQRATETAANGRTIAYSYQGDGRLSALTATLAGSSLTRSFTYDQCPNGKGRVCSIAESNGEALSYAYTPWGALASQTQTTAGQSFTTQWTYHASTGQVASMTYPNGLRLDYQWADGLLRRIDATAGGVTRAVVANATYLPFGPVTSYQDVLGQVRNFVHDLDGRLASLQSLGGNLNYAFDTRDQIKSIAGGGLWGLDYDNAGRLTRFADETGLITQLSHDANGNRSSASYSSGAWATYSTLSTNNVLGSIGSSGGARQFAYDAAGNLLRDERGGVTDCHRYDPLARLSQLERASGSISCAGTGPVAGQYRHNGLNQRTWKLAGGQQSRFVYGPGGELLMETNASTGQSKAYLWFNGQVVALQMNGTSTLHSVYSDHLARPFKVVDATQTTRWSARLKAFDRQVTLDQIGGLNLGFAGQYYDNESGLWQNWHRFYDGTTGRYTQSDPLGLAGGINSYAYAGGNPVSLVDASGLKPGDVFCSPNAAAKDAAQHARADSNKNKIEYGGWIFKSGGGFSYNIKPGGSNYVDLGGPPWFKTSVAMWHVHPPAPAGYTHENFSDEDLKLAKGENLPLYVGTPGGALKVISPTAANRFDAKTVDASQCGCGK